MVAPSAIQGRHGARAMDTTSDLATARAEQRLRRFASLLADCLDGIAQAFSVAAGSIRGFAQEA